MMYVKIGQTDDIRRLFLLIDRVNITSEVEYFPGTDKIPTHLRFEDDEDALIFCLKVGGTLCETV